MTKIEAIIRPNKLEAVKRALTHFGIDGMMVSSVCGHGRQKGHTEMHQGGEHEVRLLAKVRIEIVLKDEIVEQVIESILNAAYTGKIGDGKIFLYKLDDVIRIRSQERGVAAI